jgi:multidrug resistance efflux pump
MIRRNSRSHQISASFAHHVVPIIVWILAVVFVVGLFYNRSARIEVLGLARGQIHTVATTSTGRLEVLSVGLFESIKQGQVIAVVNAVTDNDFSEVQLKTQQETITAQIQHLDAQFLPMQEKLAAEAANLETSLAADARRFAIDVENAKLRILELRTKIEIDRIGSVTLKADLDTTRKLVEQDVIDASELQRVELQYNGLLDTIKETQTLLEQAQMNQEKAIQRRDRFAQTEVLTPNADNALEVLRQESSVYEKRLNAIAAQIQATQSMKAIEIRAPFDGIVSHLYISPGDVVDTDQPIMQISQENPSEVIAYISEYYADQIEPGIDVQVVKMGVETKMVTCQVSSVGPVVEQLPQQLWLTPNQPQWGRPFLVKVHDLELAVGEKVGIRRL